jgi:hypothetical protein
VSNPNEYDDAAYTKAVNDLNEAVGALWEAGASEENMDDEINNAVQNAVRE